MRVAKIQFSPWDKTYYFDPRDLILAAGDKVIVKTDLGDELGEITGFAEINPEIVEKEFGSKEIKPITRKAGDGEIKKVYCSKAKTEAMDVCRELIKRYGLPMKLVDVRFSLEGARTTFAFIADSRVDFRELVKELTRRFNAAIRLQQIGIRDEAKMTGDFGHCGMKLCCGNFLKNLESITSEMADLQGISSRGSERISGICGRLMCCLSFEAQGYKEMAAHLPKTGERIKAGGKTGTVISQCILRGCVKVKINGEKGEDSSIVEVKIK
ncbi:MAG: regulatory iron-sulfur-containing complex subunit RicT [Patescibacteria group bacterium]|jgi:cell fate regulator YaaT (PSP1 superfamily)